jgi:hypothetical protein
VGYKSPLKGGEGGCKKLLKPTFMKLVLAKARDGEKDVFIR